SGTPTRVEKADLPELLAPEAYRAFLQNGRKEEEAAKEPATTPKKYEILQDQTMQHEGRTLYRIRRLSDGKVGGWIEKEYNLPQDGKCFVLHSAMVFGHAMVLENAEVSGNAKVFDNAQVFGDACVSDNSKV